MKRSPFRRAPTRPKKLSRLAIVLAVLYLLAGVFFPKEVQLLDWERLKSTLSER